MLLSGSPDPDDDAIPPVRATPRSRPGDIWVLGDHAVGCGDSRDLELLERWSARARVDAAFLDPPYNVPISGHANAKGVIGRSRWRQVI